MADLDVVRSELQKAQAAVTAALAALGDPLPPPAPPLPSPTLIDTVDAFERALAASPSGTVLTLSTRLVYRAPLVLRKPIKLRSEHVWAGRIGLDEPAPRFGGGIQVLSDGVELSGLDVQHPTGNDIVVLAGQHLLLDRCRILGPPEGVKRGVAANGGDMQIVRCWIDHCRRPAQDAQAICAWDMPAPGLIIEDCYLSGAAQAVMLGGSDPKDATRSPRHVRIRRCVLTKRSEWFADGTQIKCAFEAKNCDDVEVTDTIMEGAGIDEGQQSFLIVLTPRNQSGTAPYSAVTNVRFERCTGRKAGGCVCFLGTDPTPTKPSGPLKGVTFKHCAFTEIDPIQWKGSGRLFQFEHGPQDVTLDSLTVEGKNIAALGYFIKAPPTRLVLRNLKLPGSKYGWKIDAGGMGLNALLAYAPDALIELAPGDLGASGYPRG